MTATLTDGCQAQSETVCGAPAVATLTVACLCRTVTLRKCRPHLKVVEDFIARCVALGWDTACRACGGPLTWRVVPL